MEAGMVPKGLPACSGSTGPAFTREGEVVSRSVTGSGCAMALFIATATDGSAAILRSKFGCEGESRSMRLRAWTVDTDGAATLGCRSDAPPFSGKAGTGIPVSPSVIMARWAEEDTALASWGKD